MDSWKDGWIDRLDRLDRWIDGYKYDTNKWCGEIYIYIHNHNKLVLTTILK